MHPRHDPRPGALLAEHYTFALGVARRHFPSLSDADRQDVVQEAYLKVLQRMRRAPLDHPLSYLLRVVYTTGAHLFQDPARRSRSLDADGDDLDGVELRADRSLTPLSPEEHVLSRLDASEAWRMLLEELTAEERRALAMRLVQERTPAEIAAELGMTVRRYRRLREQSWRKLAAARARARDPSPGSAADSAPARAAA
ncbi:MAG TPA: sigma-70 family RNA polymerase sigma factor [Conexibacter sp.]|jgi:RNA polymerase sigma factor (sigma-70 family)